MLEALEEEAIETPGDEADAKSNGSSSQPLPSISRDDEVQRNGSGAGSRAAEARSLCGRAVVVITVVNVVSNRGKTRAGGGTT